MKTKSIWESTYKENEKNQGKTSIITDILIIGGGIAGMSTAFHLKDCGQNIVLIDKGKIGMGVTSKTTGKLTFLQDIIYQKLAHTYNKNVSKLYLESQKDAIEIVKNIIDTYDISCHLSKVPSYLFTNEEKDKSKLKKEKEFLEMFGISCEKISNLPISYPSIQALKIEDTYVFHPLEYLYAIKEIILQKGVSIYENICAQKIEKKDDIYIVHTDMGEIRTKKVIVTTHYPFFISPGFIPFKSHIEKSYILASKWDTPIPISAITHQKQTVSLRFYEKFLLYGGQSHKMCNHINVGKRYEALTGDYKKHFKEKEISYIWSTHDVITEDGMPYIGKVNEEEDNLLLATGFNKWGMTCGSIAGKILSDIVLNKENPYTRLFKVDRSYNFERIKQSMINGINTGKIFVQTKINRNPSFYKENVKVYKEDGIYYGCYQDDKGLKHIVHNTCPHMGCSLLFNTYDLSWDCPCHGSRFDIDGKVIQGPSCYTIKVKKKDA